MVAHRIACCSAIAILAISTALAGQKPEEGVTEYRLEQDKTFGNEAFGYVVTLPGGWHIRWQWFDHPTADKTFSARQAPEDQTAICAGGRGLGNYRKRRTQDEINQEVRSTLPEAEEALRKTAEKNGGKLYRFELTEVESIVGLRITATDGSGRTRDMLRFETPRSVYMVTCLLPQEQAEGVSKPIATIMDSFKPTRQIDQ